MKKHVFHLFFLAALVLPFLTACGGGGGGGGDKTDSRVNNYNVNLKTLAVSSGTLSPVFSPDKTSYNLEVAGTTGSLVVTPELADGSSIITVNNKAVTAGQGHTEPIDADMKTITVVVTAPDNTTKKTYYISVNRVSARSGNASLAGLKISEGTLSPSFTANTTGYNVDVPYDTAGIYVTPTVAGINAAVTVNGISVDSGDESSFIPLTSAITVITVKVTAENGTPKTYIIAVNSTDGSSNANLADLRVSAGTLSGGFDPDDPDYDVIVPYITTGITVTPTVAVSGSTVTVNGIEVPSGRASGTINLDVGANLITITVTSEDDTIKTYTVKVYRIEADDNADLADLSVSAGTLSPSFDVDTPDYNVEVPYAISSIKVTPTVAASTSIVTVNNAQVTSGTDSQGIDLAVGDNTIEVQVIAENGAAKTYSIIVKRYDALSSNANLSNLTVSTGTLTPGFQPGTTEYTVELPYATTSIRIKPTVAGTNATVKVNGKTVESGSMSESITMFPGNIEIIPVVVTAEAGTINTYNITVHRDYGSYNNNLSNLTVSAGKLSPDFFRDIKEYNLIVPYTTTSVTVKPTVADLSATVKVNGMTVASGTDSGAINLSIGNNTISVVVISERETYNDYKIKIYRKDTTILSNITISPGVLPAFHSDITSYDIDLHETIPSITVSPTADNVNATITVNGIPVTSATESGQISLSMGNNTITIIVTDENGKTKTYLLNIYKANLLNFIVSSSCFSNHTMVLKSDYTLWGTGWNGKGQLGITGSPVRLVKTMTDVKYVSAGAAHTMIIKNDWKVMATGDNYYYQLGDRTGVDTSTPVAIESYGFLYISAGTNYTMCVTSKGALWGVGYNNYGQLGDGTTIPRINFAYIMTGVDYVFTGGGHTMLIKSDGTLWATGKNDCGQLGDGTTNNRLTPFQIMTDVACVSLGGNHTMLIKNDGTLWAMGKNDCGQLGDGTTNNRRTPFQIMTEVAYVATGADYTMIIKNDGTLWATGKNYYGQLGDGSKVNKLQPVQIKTNVVKVIAGEYHTIIQKSDGTFWATGYNGQGQFGNGTTTDSTTFIQLPW